MSLTPEAESIGYIVFVTAWVCPAITLPIFVMRIYATLRIIKRWRWDDTLMVMAAIFALVNSSVGSMQVHNGLGKHRKDISDETYSNFLKLSITGATTTYNLAAMCTKSSILLFYLRFPSSRSFRITAYAVLVVTVGYTLSGVLSFAYSCTPIERSWDRKNNPGTCIDSSSAILARAVFNVVTDVFILLLPIWLLWPLRLSSIWHKLSVLVVLMAGGFVCIVSGLRLAAFFTDDGLTEADHTWHYVKNSNWCLLEMWAGVFCACLPSLKCFFVHHFPGAFSSNRNRNNGPRAPVMSMARIPVTEHDEPDEPARGSPPCGWQFAARVRKKPSYGSSEPDLEARGSEEQGGRTSSNSRDRQSETHRNQEKEMTP